MRDRRERLHQALELGRRELAELEQGDVDRAESLSRERDACIAGALAGLEDEGLKPLADELRELHELQTRITAQARRLREALRGQLGNVRRQTKRISGYSRGAGNTGRYSVQRFVNKKG